MKTKLTSVTYLGFTAMDRRFSTAMLPWLLKEIRRTAVKEKLSVVIEDGYLKAFNGNFEPIIVHRLVDIIRASQVPGSPEELFYILYNEAEKLLNFYLFRASTAVEVTDLFSQMRETSPGVATPGGSTGSLNGSVMKNLSFQTSASSEHLPWSTPAISLPKNCNVNLSESQTPLVRSTSNASALTSLCADLSPSDSHFFEVLYIGKVRISQRKVPDSLIDDALVKFALHEADKARNNQMRRHSLLSSNGTSIYSTESAEQVNEDFKQKTDDISSNVEQKVKLTNTSTTPLVGDKKFFSTDNLAPEPKQQIDDEFDAFSKERVVKNGVQISRPPSSPLEPKVLVLNLNKNLHTVAEDEEKNDDVKSVTSSITRSIHEGIDKTKDESMPMNFDEISRKPKMVRSKTGLNNEMKRNSIPENKPFLRDRSASIGTLNLKTPIAQLIGEQNRTMLFQVARSELRLISPDRKQILLHRSFKDVASCVLGRTNKEHFGFVCRENVNDAYACYVFKCESDCVALEVVNAIKQAFVAHSELMKKSREKSPNMTCEHCPMLWYHRLCHDIEGMNEKKTHAFILRRIEQLPEDEQDQIITKYQGGTNHMYEVSEHNSFLMMLLRAHCEAKQLRHVHDTAENRSEFLNQYLGGSTIFMKAKRSLSSGFDHLLKRKASRDDIHIPNHLKKESSPLPTPVNDTASEPSVTGALLHPEFNRSKSMSPAVVVNNGNGIEPPPSPTSTTTNPFQGQEEDEGKQDQSNSPMMDIFLKVSDSRPSTKNDSTEHEATWRQAIYQKVVQPADLKEGDLSTQTLLNLQAPPVTGKKTKEQLRALWKMAIEQTLLLVRMEKENARLREREESSAVRRIKLEYTELGICDTGVALMWDSLLATRESSSQVSKVDHHMLTQAVIQGVPRMCRGGVWYFLAEQACLRSPPPDSKKYPLYNTPYRTLLSGLTKHQHAILIDLGRTFPQHSYFASALGPGQLSLYNILKAYSLLDPDVGYCQGLSFVAGVLLLHMEEAEAFILLRHLMFRRGLRKQYLPDMSALQVQLYQLSRLLRDHEPDLHEKLESLEISPALYAAPWMLTLFTSQFPLGFVVRIFDLVFLESTEIVFSVSLALLSIHKDGLMMCESCEEAAEYLKHKLPFMDKALYDKIIRKVHTLDISRQLTEYAVEYAVLREEMPRVTTLTETNRKLAADNRRMSDELDSAMDALTNYQNSQSKLETQVKSMEQQLTLLSRFISSYHKQEPPAEVKKIIQNYNKKTTFGSKIFSKHHDDDEDLRKTFKTGASAPNLFAKITKEDVLNAMNRESKTKTSPEKDKKFPMKKSQSVHFGLTPNQKLNSLRVLEEKSEENLMENIKELGKKTLNTEEQIKQERMFEQKLKHDFDVNLRREIKTQSYIDDLSIFQSKRSMSLNLNVTKGADSGFVTPLSPDDKKEDSMSIISHPLSDCDVDIKFDLQSTQLKQIRPVVKNFNGIEAKQM